MGVTNNFFVYVNDTWKQINSDFTNEIEYLQQLILILNNKLDKLTDNVESLNNYEDIKTKIKTLLQNKLKSYLYNYNLPSDIYQLAQLTSMITYKDENYSRCSYYIDNINGSDENTGLSIFEPRKTLPSNLDESLQMYSAVVVRLMDSPIPYDLSSLARDLETNGLGLIFRGNYQDPNKVRITNNTYAEFNTANSTDFLGFFHLTINNPIYIKKEGNIGFYNCNINSNIYLEPLTEGNTLFLEKESVNFGDYYNSDDFNSKLEYFHSTNDTITVNSNIYNDMVHIASTGYYLSPKDFEPLPANINITNLEELTIFLNYLQKAINSENININDLIDDIPEVTPSINANKQLVINNYLSSNQAGSHSIFNAPVQVYNNDTNELVGEITTTWHNNYNIFNNMNISHPLNLKIVIADLFELLYQYTITNSITVANLRTELNNNKISGTNIPNNTYTYSSAFSNGGEYHYTIANGNNYTINIPRMRFTVTNTNTAEFRFGYDYTDNNPQNYIQVLMCENNVIFNEINNNTTTKLTEFTLPTDLNNNTNVPLSFTHKNGKITINFNNEEYTTELNSPLICAEWYINIPSNNTSLRAIALNGINITEYP